MGVALGEKTGLEFGFEENRLTPVSIQPVDCLHKMVLFRFLLISLELMLGLDLKLLQHLELFLRLWLAKNFDVMNSHNLCRSGWSD